MNKDEIKEIINECMRELIGDTPIPCQLDVALRDKADTTEQMNLQVKLNALEQEVQRLANLIGDTSVAEQIYTALNG
jgi:hypothetical protein